jgi:hypothetical protein
MSLAAATKTYKANNTIGQHGLFNHEIAATVLSALIAIGFGIVGVSAASRAARPLT